MLTSGVVVSAVRSHNVARVSKSHESFGDRFSTVTIDDLITSDLQAAVKGTRCAGVASSSISPVTHPRGRCNHSRRFPAPQYRRSRSYSGCT